MSEQLTISEQSIAQAGVRDNFPCYTVNEGLQVYDRVAACPWLQEIALQLQAIAALSDGWDSYGASSPDANKVNAAWSLIVCLCESANLPKPYVNPTRNGGVQFEWEVGERYFELEVVAERAATYFYCDGDSHVEESGDIFEDESLETVLAYVHRVTAIP